MIWRPVAYVALAIAAAAGAWGVWQAWSAADLRADLTLARQEREEALTANASLADRLERMRAAQERLSVELARVDQTRAEYERIIRDIEEMEDESPVPPAVRAVLEQLRARACRDQDRDAAAGCPR